MQAGTEEERTEGETSSVGGMMDFEDFVGISAVIVCVIIGIVFVILLGAALFFSFGLSTGVGEQAGYISEVEQSGWLWRPAEVRLISIEPTFSEKDTSWEYGSASDNVTAECKKFMKSHEKIVVTYEVRQVTANWEYANRVVITGIRKLE